MTTTDWLIDIALLLIVLRQLREERLTARTILLPLGMIAWAASNYLTDIPTAGNDVLLAVIFAVTGVVLGLAGGLLTRVRHAGGHVLIKATRSAAALWIISMGFRLGFAVWSTHASGTAHLTSFSAAHDITSGQAWVVALLLMAVGEVVVRLGTIIVRGQLLQARVDREAKRTASRPGAYA
ncbi:hypothetical protein [Streptomyces sp. NRRL F-525]|uniref:hypothetical protein n=1 Tax=Streptomyces sp. NRRL F-525 TaxID=1463861 RepID=UPI000525591F|nr:hypothetical protein [Streptomyces sp. NRRL F-525]